jgi:hypothetical protein
MKCEIFNCFNSLNPVFNSYSKSSQEKIVQEVYKRSLEMNDSQTRSLIKKVVLSPPRQEVRSTMDHPLGEAFNSFLLADPTWHKKIPSTEEALSFLPSILWKADKALFKSAKQWLQAKIISAPREVLDKRMLGIYVRNLLSYYPFFSPEEGEEIRLPLGPLGLTVTYKVEPIELTHPAFGSPLMAYGLTPNHLEAAPILLFKGTTYPSDKGFFLSILTDLNPYGAVGSFAFQLSARERVKAWLSKCSLKAEVMGASLGGSLSLQTASECSEYIKVVHAFNSPGVSSIEVRSWEKSKEKPEVNVYLQDQDPISTFIGRCFASDWNVYRVFAPNVAPSQVHASAYTAHPESFIIPEDTQKINADYKRKVWPFFQNIVLTPLFILGVVYLAIKVVALKIGQIFANLFFRLVKA